VHSRLPALGLLASLAVCSCAPPVVPLKPVSQHYTAADYDAVYERWTRHARAFDFGQLRSVLNASATFEAPEFRWAYVVRYTEDYAIAPETRTDMLRQSLADADLHHRFVVTLGNGRPKELDLTSPESAFRIVLVDDRGRTLAPIEITRVRKPSVAERSYFQTISPYRLAFRVVFAAKDGQGLPTLAPDAHYAVLRLTGPGGQVDLKWEFREGLSDSKRVKRR
jgi:hypothetical protein